MAQIGAIRARRRRQAAASNIQERHFLERTTRLPNKKETMFYDILWQRISDDDSLVGEHELLNLLQLIEPRQIKSIQKQMQLVSAILTLTRPESQSLRIGKEKFSQFVGKLTKESAHPAQEWPPVFLPFRYALMTLFKKITETSGVCPNFVPFVLYRLSSIPNTSAGDTSATLNTDDGCSCSICRDELQLNQVILHPSCRHLFHEQCITLWLQSSKACPMCRRNVLLGAAKEAKRAGSDGIFSKRMLERRNNCIIQ